MAAHRYVLRYLHATPWFGSPKGFRELLLRCIERVITPLGALAMLLVGRKLLASIGFETSLLNIIAPLVGSYALIKLTVYLLRKGFRSSPALKAWEQIISTSIWIVVALYIMGWLDDTLLAMDALGMEFGDTRVSLLSVSKLILVVALFFIMAMWLSRQIERRVMRARFIDASLQVGLTKVSHFTLLTIAILMALDAVGIDLTAFAVFGGAVGVGLGFGLQRIASNFISGFILILDRSIKPGDVITIGEKFGWVKELRARYIVVMNREGVETLIPNENLITSEVINWSYSNQNVRLRIPVQISYNDDPEKAMEILIEAANASPRVLRDPATAVRLMGFGDSGMDLEVRVWINDPESGLASVRSDINLEIWRRFKEEGITIPYPVRDVNVRGLSGVS
ncbi:MAG: mechanosensitive ion channel [Gammaproteobacteria bacterium]|nr:mechanosensitive ion channel [Gammaproteobacteria bacterium]